MIDVIPSGKTLGASITGLDLSVALPPATVDAVKRALGEYGVLRFPRQQLTPQQLVDFSARFGKLEINVANSYQEPGLPQIMILSNIQENGKPIGLSDAGQNWHTDMSYSKTIAFANVLYGIKIPVRDGKTLGNTEFCNMHAAYDDLPGDLKQKLDGKTVLHDFNKFWAMKAVKNKKRECGLSIKCLQVYITKEAPATGMSTGERFKKRLFGGSGIAKQVAAPVAAAVAAATPGSGSRAPNPSAAAAVAAGLAAPGAGVLPGAGAATAPSACSIMSIFK